MLFVEEKTDPKGPKEGRHQTLPARTQLCTPAGSNSSTSALLHGGNAVGTDFVAPFSKHGWLLRAAYRALRTTVPPDQMLAIDQKGLQTITTRRAGAKSATFGCAYEVCARKTHATQLHKKG